MQKGFSSDDYEPNGRGRRRPVVGFNEGRLG
jgi:hypothetical protein